MRARKQKSLTVLDEMNCGDGSLCEMVIDQRCERHFQKARVPSLSCLPSCYLQSLSRVLLGGQHARVRHGVGKDVAYIEFCLRWAKRGRRARSFGGSRARSFGGLSLA